MSLTEQLVQTAEILAACNESVLFEKFIKAAESAYEGRPPEIHLTSEEKELLSRMTLPSGIFKLIT